MTTASTIARSLHDIGLASWFGGTLMGAVGLNGGAAAAKDPRERTRVSSAGWMKWSPVLIGSMAAHAAGSVAMLANDKERLIVQGEGRTSAIVKTGITLAAGAASVYSGIVGQVQSKHAGEPAAGANQPSAGTSAELSGAQRQQAWLQWVPPVLTAVLIVLAAQQGEQQRATAPALAAPGSPLARLKLPGRS
ncbi:MAG: conserved rane protein [Naasia sp.]|nr:conserved rane protein [Naasia sp.]